MNILVVGNISSIHDEKWITFLSKNCANNFYIVQEEQNLPLTNEQKKNYEECGVKILPNLPSFSLFQFWKSIKGWLQIKKWVIKYKIKCIHVIFPTPHIFWVNFCKIPLIVSTRGSDVLVVTKELIEKPSIKNKILLNLFNRNLKKSNFITSTSELQKVFLEQNFDFTQNKVSIVRTGIDIDFIDHIDFEKKNNNEIRIFSPRFFSPIYNILYLIEAIQNLPISTKNKIHLQLVEGKNYSIDYRDKIIEKLKHVDFKYSIQAYFNKKELIQEYKKSDLVIMIPHSDGTPNSALETMICKVPLIISDLDYQSPLFSETCLLVNPKDIHQITLTIIKALEDYPSILLENGRLMTELHGDQKKEMMKIIELYNLIEHKKRA